MALIFLQWSPKHEWDFGSIVLWNASNPGSHWIEFGFRSADGISRTNSRHNSEPGIVFDVTKQPMGPNFYVAIYAEGGNIICVPPNA